MDLSWGALLATIGIGIPAVAFVWEFVVVRRKRLGYRVQLDTKTGTQLGNLSYVLVRFENNGVTTIDTNDYRVPDGAPVGIRIVFPGRKITGIAITELSDESLRHCFGPDSGLARTESKDGSGRPVGVIELPRVPLNRGEHFKVLATLKQSSEAVDDLNPRVEAALKAGSVKGTKSRTGPSRPVITLIVVLVAVILGQLIIDIRRPDAASLDCATGNLAIAGSTAFASIVTEATKYYKSTCRAVTFTLDFRGSDDGLRRLNQTGQAATGSPDMLAFSDGVKGDGYPQLLPRSIALTLFTLVINKEAGVQDLSFEQIGLLYDGRITNWKEIGGNDRPVRLVSRNADSGTRKVFQAKILGKWESVANSRDCRDVPKNAQPGIVRCERSTTGDVLTAVAEIPGALGYSELGNAGGRKDLLLVRIGGQQATLEGVTHTAYPFWETEYAYTYGEPKADSLAASFLRYLTNQVGKDIIRSHGSSRPCAELENPVLCRPS